VTADAVLDDPVGSSLDGHHAAFARRKGRMAVYDAEVATFAAVPPDPSAADWADLAGLLGPGGFADLFSAPGTPPSAWEPIFTLPGLQFVAGESSAAASPPRGLRLVELGPGDVDQMRALVARTRPGPFWARTCEMGGYLGVRDGETLVAMAGERLHPPGWTEISAVCTAPEARGRGLAATLVSEVAARIVARGERPFLHVAADNAAALRLYDALGYQVRREVTFRGFRVPGR